MKQSDITFLSMSMPAGLLSAIVIGLWSDLIGNAVPEHAFGAFIGVYGSFMLIHFMCSDRLTGGGGP